jgi:hypothetical protein
MEAASSPETSVITGSTRRHIQEDGLLHSHCRENLKSHIILLLRVSVTAGTCLHVLPSNESRRKLYRGFA